MTVQDRLSNKLGLLTQSERECLRMVAQHMRSKEIARSRGTSPYTVNRQIESACKKLGAASRQDAARMWLAVEADGPGHIPNESPYDPFGMVKDRPSVSVGGATEAYDDNGINNEFARNGDHQFYLETARTAAPGSGGRPGTGIHGAPSGFGARETIPVSRGDPAAERDHEDGGLRIGSAIQAIAWPRRLSPRTWVIIFAISAFGGAILLAGILSAINASMTLVAQISGR
jgi:DNA-binding CsgD family transcriptional regulator